MQAGQAAVIWTLVDTRETSPTHRSTPQTPRRSFAGRFGDQLRRIAFRAQLGPVGGHAPA